jgi:hypothetical protein
MTEEQTIIDVSSLNIDKQYVGYQIGKNYVSKLIQRLSKEELELYNSSIQLGDVATHIFMLRHEDGDWYVLESHAKWKGTKKMPYIEWLSQQDCKAMYCYERDFSINLQNYYLDYNPGYSLADISRFAFDEVFGKITDKTVFNNGPGIVCSEFAALSELNKGKDSIPYIYDIKSFMIKPIHYQLLDPKYEETTYAAIKNISKNG